MNHDIMTPIVIDVRKNSSGDIYVAIRQCVQHDTMCSPECMVCTINTSMCVYKICAISRVYYFVAGGARAVGGYRGRQVGGVIMRRFYVRTFT